MAKRIVSVKLRTYAVAQFRMSWRDCVSAGKRDGMKPNRLNVWHCVMDSMYQLGRMTEAEYSELYAFPPAVVRISRG